LKNIIIFGAGEFGKNIYNIYKNEYNILYFCDNNQNLQNQSIFNIKIISPDKLKLIKYDKIIIASTYVEEIYNQLTKSYSINKNKIKKLYVNESNIQFYNHTKKQNTEIFMKYISNILKKNNINYYLDHGTLLGIVRDNNLIPWDKDVDFAILSENENKVLKILESELFAYKHPNCKTNNWKYKVIKDKMNIDEKITNIIIEIQIYNDSKFISDFVALDIMIRYKYNNKLYWKVAQKELSVDYDLCFPLSTINFNNYKFNIPGNVNKYLEILFGNWKKVDKQWSYEKYNNLKV
jgi:phosphorylcholine metabolism protein LicD